MKRFKKIYIEITNVCNMSCEFCPKTIRKTKFMDCDEFSHIISEVKPFTDYVYFHLMGEPLLHQKLSDFLSICEANKLKVNITTNGTLIDQVKPILLSANSLRKVGISLHSFEANDTAIDFMQYVDSVLKFAMEASKRDIICELRLWNMDNNQTKASNQLNEEIFKIIETTLGLDYDLRLKMHEVGSLKLDRNLYLGMAERFEWPDISRMDIGEEAFCYGLRDQMGILVDGTVVPCCLDSEGNIPLGNIFDTSLKEILESSRASALYEGFSKRCAVEALCKRCGYARRF